MNQNVHESPSKGHAATKGMMLSLFEKDQLPAVTRTRAKPEQSHAQSRISPVVGGVRVTSINPALTVMPGQVRLDSLNDENWPKQLSEFLYAYGRSRCNNFQTKVSEETLRNRTDILFSSIRLLMEDKQLRHVKTLAQVKPRLMPRLFELWTAKGISKRAQINYFTNMRWFWRICGMEIGAIANFSKEADEFKINRNAETDRSWKGNGVDFEVVYQKLHELDPVGARLARAMKQYGLRLKESLRLEPHLADGIDRLLITKGAKTGRPRQLMFDVFEDENFRRVLDELKAEVPPECHLAWTNRTLKQAKDRMYYLARQLGLKKNGSLKVTFHGLRHDFAIDQLEELTGQTAPVRGGIVINYRALSAARLKVTQALGHNRLKVTGAYYGSFLSLEREQMRSVTRSWDRIEPVMKDVGQLIEGSGAGNLFWIGGRSQGSKSEAAPYEFVFPPGTDDAIVLRLAPQICELVQGATGVDCIVHNWKSMPSMKQALWETDGTPIFQGVGPLEYMKAMLEQQKAARMKGGVRYESAKEAELV
ncbi:hypothetical protein Rfer_4486 (plasmid) [Rhodoferax ferrireducens T118]|uniref:Uncharacterized protein n=1 Tax=Albidiferax ferrireducens (strain ATCC BAA-621 / DSM 15236 / T118) TaxID=338969 RepID=Q21PX4_ALBFT|nr:integrase domain-containing protein [Rhodoferax ferrireducens]ABD72171.1 hypothetical protein Rfer_4486 [Rhodoferax ferrireducens T118]